MDEMQILTFIKKLLIPLKIIAIIEIYGGICGLLSIPVFLFKTETDLSTIEYLAQFIFMILFALSIFGGIYLWKNKRIGYVVSIVIQLLQVVQFYFLNYKYIFISGLGIEYYVGYFETAWNFKLGQRSSFFWSEYYKMNLININFIAIIFILVLVYMYWVLKPGLKKNNNSDLAN